LTLEHTKSGVLDQSKFKYFIYYFLEANSKAFEFAKLILRQLVHALFSFGLHPFLLIV
jgi:hypothetical protein